MKERACHKSLGKGGRGRTDAKEGEDDFRNESGFLHKGTKCCQLQVEEQFKGHPAEDEDRRNDQRLEDDVRAKGADPHSLGHYRVIVQFVSR